MKTQEELLDHLGGLIEMRIEELDENQSSVARLLGTHQQTVNAVVRGRHGQVSPYTLLRWLERLGVDARLKIEVTQVLKGVRK